MKLACSILIILQIPIDPNYYLEFSDNPDQNLDSPTFHHLANSSKLLFPLPPRG